MRRMKKLGIIVLIISIIGIILCEIKLISLDLREVSMEIVDVQEQELRSVEHVNQHTGKVRYKYTTQYKVQVKDGEANYELIFSENDSPDEIKVGNKMKVFKYSSGEENRVGINRVNIRSSETFAIIFYLGLLIGGVLLVLDFLYSD